jgi:hypothetical protein
MPTTDPTRELRRFPRFPADLRVKVNFKVNGTLQRAMVKTIEIATHGVSITSPLQLPENSQIDLEILLPGTRTPMLVKALIRNRCGTRYGVEFLSVTEAQREEISNFGNGRKPSSSVAPVTSPVPAVN